MRYEMIITDPEDIKAFEEYDGRILSQEESESLKEASEYYKSHVEKCKVCGSKDCLGLEGEC